jgi:hypothetical protein
VAGRVHRGPPVYAYPDPEQLRLLLENEK